MPPDQAENLKLNPQLKVLFGDTIRITFLSLDAAQRAGDSPLKDERVRRAIAHAIDRDAIVKLLNGMVRPLLAVSTQASETKLLPQSQPPLWVTDPLSRVNSCSST